MYTIRQGMTHTMATALLSLTVVAGTIAIAAPQDTARPPAGEPSSQRDTGVYNSTKDVGMRRRLQPDHAMPMKCQGMQDCDRQMQQMHLSMLQSGDVDRNFAEMMIRHHEHGIEMARAQAKNGKDVALRQQAQKILESQQKELAELERWMQSQQPAGAPKSR